MLLFRKLTYALLAVVVTGACALPKFADAAAVTIVVNGQTVNFDQPPEERAGRVFVPLRGVFERLGASVVYANGQINATGSGHSVSLHIGSTAATVNGQPVTVDVAPFLVGARTLVPLRFVAQALGATVNYNDSTRTVAINGGSAPVTVTPMPAPGNNFIQVTAPRPGVRVGSSFLLTGRTRANSSVTVAATGQALIGGVLPISGGTYQNSTTADNTGYFSLTISIRPIPGGSAHVTIRSVAPGGATATRTFIFPS
ncbi:MAG: hypothetical protein DLM50_02500 [Candidatus Meridianibacter frigidus]|nr:MAG: hypothetical protein DLM50_02500 [Candidatus Eremiobacteraeota bacterium]